MSVVTAEDDFLDPHVLAEPYGFFRRARERSPVVKIAGRDGRPDFFLVTTYRLIVEVTENPSLFSSDCKTLVFGGKEITPRAREILAEGWPGTSSALLLTSDDPDHRRLRSLVGSVFTPIRIAAMATPIERIVDELIDGFIQRGECDFRMDFAIRLPTYAIADILGIDRGHYAFVAECADAIEVFVGQMGSAEEEIAAARLVVEFQRFLMAEIQARRAYPRDDLISDLVRAHVDGAPSLSDVELLTALQELTVAGSETMRSALMCGFTRLLEQPDQYAALIAEPALVPNAIEEILRYETPASSIWRRTTRDAELAGVAIPAGAAVLLRYDSANRDDAKFPDGDRFDVRRSNARMHLAFSHGIHNCLGAPLARRELNIAVPKLLNRLRNLRLVPGKGDTSYLPHLLIHTMRGPFLAFDPGPRIFAAATAR